MVLRRGRRVAALVAFLATTLGVGVLTMAPANAAQGAGSAAGSTTVRLALPATAADAPPLDLGSKNVVSGDCAAVRADQLRAAARGVHKEALCATSSSKAVAKPAAATARAATTYWCAKYGVVAWWINRHEECLVGLVDTVNAFLDGDIVGTATFTINQNIVLSPVTGIFTEDDSIQFTSGTEVLDVPTTITFDAACTSPCSTLSGSNFSAIAPNETVQFHDAYEDTPSGQDNLQTEYEMLVAPPPTFPPANPAVWGSAATIRCDNQLTKLPTGCVLPQYTPTLHLSAGVEGAGAINVGVGEQYLVGNPGTTNSPLTRLINPTLQAQYGTAMCGNKTFQAIVEVTDDSCDEYPFKSTNQSGGAFNLTGPSCLQAIPYKEGGSWFVAFIGNYSPTAQYQCLIGHVTKKQNLLVGSHLAAFYSLNRVLNSDPFAIAVTA